MEANEDGAEAPGAVEVVAKVVNGAAVEEDRAVIVVEVVVDMVVIAEEGEAAAEDIKVRTGSEMDGHQTPDVSSGNTLLIDPCLLSSLQDKEANEAVEVVAEDTAEDRAVVASEEDTKVSKIHALVGDSIHT